MNLYPHQVYALAQTERFNRVAYYLDMGLGKTFVGSEKAVSFDEKILIICQKSKVEDWLDHFRKYYPLLALDMTSNDGLERFIRGKGKCVGIINYDLVFRRQRLLGLEDYSFTLMLDESSEIQNETTKRAKAILKMKPKNVILLSGTPTAGRYERLWSQLRLLGWEISKDLYYKQYVISEWKETDGFFRREILGYQNVDRLKRKLAEHGAVFMKSEEVFDLPEQNVITVKTKPVREYRQFMKERVVTLGEREFIGDTALTRRLYARMMCSYLNPNRLEAFKDLAESTEERLVVFYNFTEELKAMLKIVGDERPVSVVNGETKDLEAYEKYDNSITFLQYQAGAMGLNLQKANKVIYFSLTERSELFEQSKKRVHRIGQEKNCFYYILMCKGTVEEDILKNLELRRDYSDELFRKYEESFN